MSCHHVIMTPACTIGRCLLLSKYFSSRSCLVSATFCCLKCLQKELDDLHRIIASPLTLSVAQSLESGHLHLFAVVFRDWSSSLSKEIQFMGLIFLVVSMVSLLLEFHSKLEVKTINDLHSAHPSTCWLLAM